MKRLNSLLLLAICCVCCFAQEPVLSFEGDLYFIPGSMTKSGEAFMVSAGYNNDSFIIYDGEFNVVKTFTDPTAGQPYQSRMVTMTRIYDPSTDGWGNGNITRSVTEDWTVIDDQIYDNITSSTISGFEVYSDDNSYHSRELFVSQTLFDDDEEFEYVRRKQTIIPITTKYSDYAKEHSNGNETYYTISYGDKRIDSLMNATGASAYQWFWDEETGKQLIRLYKHETYGGLFDEGLEIASLDGSVKATLPGVSSISSAYCFRGTCYVKGYSSAENCSVLYQLGGAGSGVSELSRTKAGLSVRRIGNELVIDCNSDEQQTIVMSTMDGRVVKSLTAKHGSNAISLDGLMGGIYNVTLYRQSSPVRSSKISIR
ncbi:MAG: hypothetical protein J5486_05940 [Bacteroidaceae bacterium]|nr:hypothetical protein [Bacteroidaceae bacterium]